MALSPSQSDVRPHSVVERAGLGSTAFSPSCLPASAREAGRGLSSGAGVCSGCVTHSPDSPPYGRRTGRGVPLRRSTPPPPTPPAPVARTAWKLGGGLEGGEGEHARDQEELVEIGVHVVVIGVAPAWTVEAAGNAGLPEMRGVVTR